MVHPAPDPELAVAYLRMDRDPAPLLAEASRLRDEGKGRVVTYSRKVFVPLTTLCRDRCTYCTFAKPPGGGGQYLHPEEVLAIVAAGESHGCTEALFTLGDKPELRWRQAGEFLAGYGAASTLDYVRMMTELVVRDTTVLPHANPGVMTAGEMAALRPSNPSMGLMLENISNRLMEPGMPHHDCPDKHPSLRVGVIETAGKLRVPFTSGILIGIGETSEEVVASLVALAELQQRWGCLQEVIVQNFRPKADTPMRRHAEPGVDYFTTVVAAARWLLGPGVNLQAPPNLTQHYEALLGAGINDWGGVSPLTIDWVNPEAPWPHLADLEARTSAAGFELRPRLPVYPEFIDGDWIDPELLRRVVDVADSDGYAAVSRLSSRSVT